jgi:hypothetical protein
MTPCIAVSRARLAGKIARAQNLYMIFASADGANAYNYASGKNQVSKTFRDGILFYDPAAGKNGAASLAVYAVVSACGTVDGFNKRFECDANVVGPVAGQ